MVIIARKFLILLSNMQQIQIKTDLKRAVERTTDDLIGKTITDKISKFSKTLQQYHSETVRNEHDEDIPIEIKHLNLENWLEINVNPRGTYNNNSQIKFKNLMLKSSLCNYSNAYILVNGTMPAANTAAAEVFL